MIIEEIKQRGKNKGVWDKDGYGTRVKVKKE
jgi:hypothetical protein